MSKMVLSDEIPDDWIWRNEVVEKFGIPYSSLCRYETNKYYYPHIGKETPKLKVHRKGKYVFYERSEIAQIVKIRKLLES